MSITVTEQTVRSDTEPDTEPDPPPKPKPTPGYQYDIDKDIARIERWKRRGRIIDGCIYTIIILGPIIVFLYCYCIYPLLHP